MNAEIARGRRFTNTAMLGLCGLAAMLASGLLLLLVLHVLVNGIQYVRLDFLTSMPTPMGTPGGGIAHAIVGSILMVSLACVIGVPLGMAIGIWLSDYAPPRAANVVRFVADLQAGVPSIVVGIFGYTLLVQPLQHFSALAGVFALAFISLPIVARTTEETLRLVPQELREGALALGIPRWRSVVSVVLPTASAGLVTAAILALARLAGETAPLIFTALGNNFWNTDLNKPMAAMTLSIFQYAIWPYQYLQEQAWAASFFLLVFVFVVSVLARFAARRGATAH